MRWYSPSSIAAFCGYALLSFGYFGIRLLPHPGREVVGSGADPDIFIWSFAWWPHAILNGENPIVTHAVWAPDGINLAWVTSVPGLALAFAPLTLAFGPALSYNVAALLLPALAAWTAFLLCRYLTGSFWPSAAGGYLFGFSSYMLGQTLGHMHMSSVFLLPLVALVVLRFVRAELDGRGLAWRLGILLGVEFTFSTELLFTLSFSLLVALAITYAAVADARPRLRALPLPLLGAYGIAALIASPLVVYALLDFETGSVNPPGPYGTDLLNLVVPTHLAAAATSWTTELAQRFPANDAERAGYLGPPVLAIVAWAGLRRRTPGMRFLLIALGAAVLVELGTSLHVAGHRVVALPWELVSRLPLFNNSLPSRFALFASLAAAVIVALWAASEDVARWARVVLTVLAVVLLMPTLREPNWTLHPERPEFFAHHNLVTACLAKGENVLIYPYGWRNHSMLWQAENDFHFRMAGGYLRPDPPKTFTWLRGVTQALRGDPTISEIFQVARAKKVSRILSVERYAHPTGAQLDRATGAVQLLGGVLVAPACGHPGIAG